MYPVYETLLAYPTLVTITYQMPNGSRTLVTVVPQPYFQAHAYSNDCPCPRCWIANR